MVLEIFGHRLGRGVSADVAAISPAGTSNIDHQLAAAVRNPVIPLIHYDARPLDGRPTTITPPTHGKRQIVVRTPNHQRIPPLTS